ncbi:SPW repeat protein [Albidovulum sp.]|uniref:SPW repeat protein n=1 Tax=Albidovulum sp. TaxID=1872424 RepID=UPI0039B852ED
MADFMKKATGTWQDGLMLLLGIWLFFSPWILGFAGIQLAFWNALLFGVILAGLSIAVITEFHDWEEWVDLAVGVWLVVSPWVLGFAAFAAAADAAAYAATMTFVATGVVTLALAAWSLRHHHAAHAA